MNESQYSRNNGKFADEQGPCVTPSDQQGRKRAKLAELENIINPWLQTAKMKNFTEPLFSRLRYNYNESVAIPGFSPKVFSGKAIESYLAVARGYAEEGLTGQVQMLMTMDKLWTLAVPTDVTDIIMRRAYDVRMKQLVAAAQRQASEGAIYSASSLLQSARDVANEGAKYDANLREKHIPIHVTGPIMRQAYAAGLENCFSAAERYAREGNASLVNACLSDAKRLAIASRQGLPGMPIDPVKINYLQALLANARKQGVPTRSDMVPAIHPDKLLIKKIEAPHDFPKTWKNTLRENFMTEQKPSFGRGEPDSPRLREFEKFIRDLPQVKTFVELPTPSAEPQEKYETNHVVSGDDIRLNLLRYIPNKPSMKKLKPNITKFKPPLINKLISYLPNKVLPNTEIREGPEE